MKRLVFASLLLLVGCQTVPETLPVVAVSSSDITQTVAYKGRKNPTLKAEYVESVLGAPTLRRKENPSEVWVYAKNTCVLFIYMNQVSEVKHMEIGTSTYDQTEKQSYDCLKVAAKLR